MTNLVISGNVHIMATASLVIPAYNEAVRLPVFLETIKSFNTSHPGGIAEVLVVDDGSSDGTIEVAKTFLDTVPHLTVLRHETNKGKGAAVRTGVMAAAGELIVFMDADGATPIEELPKMRSALAEADIAVGNRWLPGAMARRNSALRTLSGWTYRSYMSLFGLGDVDTMCGFKGYRAPVARDLFDKLIDERWLFDAEIAYRAKLRGYSVRNFPISWTSKEGSKLTATGLISEATHIWPLLRKVKKVEVSRGKH